MSNKAAESSNITKIDVYSNYGEVRNIHGGVSSLQIFESIFDTTIRASANIIDTGFREGRDNVSGMEVDDLHLTVGEKTIISVVDNNGTSLNLEMRVRAVGNVVEHTQYIGYTMDWYSKESVENEFLDNRVVKRYEGKITDYVPKIFKECLKSEKPLKIDPCINTFNFLGHVQKPNYILTWLAKRTVPDIAPLGDLAGYFFWETTDGFNYRSIDKIFQGKPVRKLIFNNTPYTPAGYDAKILDYSWNENISMDKKLLTSAFNRAQQRTFDPFSNGYNEDEFDSTVQFKYNNIGGLEKPKVNVVDNVESKMTRMSSNWLDTGVLPPGSTLAKQLTKSKDYVNFDMNDILRQSYIRYNNLFSYKLNIRIAGDFGIHAGDLIWVDFPEVSDKVNQIISKKKGGIYMVIDVAHYITSRGTFTGLNLARESILRPPVPPTNLFKNSNDAVS
jgi:hypothetical protein